MNCAPLLLCNGLAYSIKSQRFLRADAAGLNLYPNCRTLNLDLTVPLKS